MVGVAMRQNEGIDLRNVIMDALQAQLRRGIDLNCVPPMTTWIEQRVRQLRGFAKSQPPSGCAIMGTPCEVPVPKK